MFQIFQCCYKKSKGFSDSFCLYLFSLPFSRNDRRLFSFSAKVWCFMNSKVWVHFIHCTVYPTSSFNQPIHVLSLNYFTDDFIPICVLFSLSETLIISLLDLLDWPSNFLVFFFHFFIPLYFLLSLESFWTFSPTLVSFYFCYYSFNVQEPFLGPSNDLCYLYSALRIKLFLK